MSQHEGEVTLTTLALRASAPSMFHVKRRLQSSRRDYGPGLKRVRLPCVARARRAASRAVNRGPTSRSLMGVVATAPGRPRGRQRRRGWKKRPGSLAWSLATALRWAGSLPVPAVLPGALSKGPGPDRLGRRPDCGGLRPGRRGRARRGRRLVRQYPEKGRCGSRLVRDLLLPGGQLRVRAALLSRVHTPAR